MDKDTFGYAVELLQEIENEPRGKARAERLKDLDCPILRKVFVYALSPYITFGVKKIPDFIPQGTDPLDDSSPYSGTMMAEVEQILDGLAVRDLTGNDAIEALGEFISGLSDVEAFWFDRILKQDLRLNMGASEVNKSLGELVIPVFKVPLATDFLKVPLKDFAGRWAIQPKFDGGRVVAYMPKNGGTVILLSRTGKAWFNFESIRRSVQLLNETWPSDQDRYLDGEVVSIVNGRIDFQSIQKTMHAKSRATEIGELQYHVFDGAYADEWENPQYPYTMRQKFADGLVECANVPNIFKVDTQIVEDLDGQLLAQICEHYTLEGYEGAMARNADQPVARKRSKLLLKAKTFETGEATIIGAVEGTGKYVGMMGALECLYKNGKKFEIGTGFSDAERDLAYWLKKIAEKPIAHFRFQRLTDAGVPLLPSWRGLRHKDDMGPLVEEDDDE